MSRKLLIGIALYCLMIGLIVQRWWPAEQEPGFTLEDVNWPNAAMCLFERLDITASFEKEGRVLHFCVVTQQRIALIEP